MSAGAGQLPAPYWWLFAGQAVNSSASFVLPFLALFLTARGFRTEEAGLVVGLFGGGLLVSGPLAGLTADRFGRRPTILVSLFGGAAATAVLPALHQPAALAAAVGLLGLVASAYRPASSAAVVDLVPPEGRTRAFGLLYWVANLGMSLSAAGGGLLAARGFGLLFLFDAATTLVFALLVWWQVPETRPAAPAGGATPGGYREVLADRWLLLLLGLQLLFLVPFLQFMVALPVHMSQLGLGPAVYGRVLAVNGVAIALLQPLAARWLRGLDAGPVLAVASALVGIGVGAYGLCASAWQFAGATLLWSLGEILAFPTVATLVAALAPAHLRGRYQGLYSVVWGVAMLVSPVLGASVLDRLGARALFSGCLVTCLAVAAGHLAAGPGRRRRLAALAQAEGSRTAA
ncbi:MAG: MFS transporter [Deltaproteobacteria bacterium]|nr:MFS transporter [Deltaproteobacteria bacterium]